MWLCGSCGFCGSCVSNIRQTRSTSRFARFWSLWISCGSCVGGFVVFGHVWFLALVLRVRSTSCGFGGSVVLPSMPMLMIARPLARRSCASSGFPYCQKPALELQALAREPPLVVPTKRRACAWLALACWSLWSLWSLWSSLSPERLAGLRPLLLPRASPQARPKTTRSAASLHNVRRRPPMDARSLQAYGNQNSRMRA